MPRYRKKGTTYRRATDGKKRRVTRRNNTLMKTRVTAGLGFPKQMMMTHRFIGSVSLLSTSGAMARQTYRANGMFDPDFTGVGHQPMCFDQMAALYNHYTVIGSKVTVRISNNSSTGVGALLLLNDDSTLASGALTVQAEQSQSNKITIVPAGGSERVMTHKFSAKKNFGGNVMSNPNLRGTSSADPFEQMYFDLLTSPVDATSTVTVNAYVYVEYIAIWSELKDIPRS